MALNIKPFLLSLPELADVEEHAIDWLVEKGEIIHYPAGEMLFRPGDPIDHMSIVLKGRVDVYSETEGTRTDFFLFEPGNIMGNLPFSRFKGAMSYGKVIEDLEVYQLHKDYFVEMVSVSYKLTQALVATMSDRIRTVSQSQFQEEKLKALGKLSAGLAHELNNPASAIVRAADRLYRQLSETPAHFKAVMNLNVTPEQTDQINEVMFQKINAWKQHPKDFSVLERQDRIDDLLDWLDDHGVAEAEDIAEILTDFDFTVDNLDSVNDMLNAPEKLSPILRWFEDRLSVEQLVLQICAGSKRVADLIQSVKQYSYMDQGSGKINADLHQGLRTTLTVLNYQLKQKNITVEKFFEENLPAVEANPGELNQVWTNLIANAIDAVEQNGKITITTRTDRDYICVSVADNGNGIAPENINRIWEPFFTTKKVGEGTGIGLDIVKKIIQRHRGNITVESQPGRTIFTVKLLKR